MKCIVQRVLSASVSVNNKIIAEIQKGLLVLIGISSNDNEKSANDMVDKIINLRIFDDKDNKLNLSVKDIDGEILLVPNFTIYANTAHGRRPDFVNCASSTISKPLFDMILNQLKCNFAKTSSGEFGANMQVKLINDGPLTVILEK